MAQEERRARIVDIHHVRSTDGSKSYYERNITRSEKAPVSEHVARARAIDKRGAAGATDLPGKHLGVVIEAPRRPATKDFTTSGVAELVYDQVDSGGTVEFVGTSVKLTRDDLPKTFH